VGRLKEQLGYPDDEIIQAYEKASAVHPDRVEALHAASRFCRIKKMYQKGYELASMGMGKPYPSGSLFGEPYAYDVGLWDEFAVNAYWVGQYSECIKACLLALKTGQLYGEAFQRVLGNTDFALQKMVEQQRNSS